MYRRISNIIKRIFLTSYFRMSIIYWVAWIILNLTPCMQQWPNIHTSTSGRAIWPMPMGKVSFWSASMNVKAIGWWSYAVRNWVYRDLDRAHMEEEIIHTLWNVWQSGTVLSNSQCCERIEWVLKSKTGNSRQWRPTKQVFGSVFREDGKI